MILSEPGDLFDKNELIYIDTLGAKVKGTISCIILDRDKLPTGETKQFEIAPFLLDLPVGQSLIENQNFKSFWDKAKELKAKDRSTMT
jgi:hypothetical protein